MQIDNPSQMWLLVEPIHKYIPPQTLSRTFAYPGTANVAIKFVAAPTNGIASVQAGGPLSIILDDDADALDDVGVDYGLRYSIDQLDLSIDALKASVDALNGGFGLTYTGFGLTAYSGVTTAGNFQVIAGTFGKQIVLLACNFVWGVLGALPRPRGIWRPTLYDPNSGNGVAAAVLDAETKLSDFQLYPPRSIVLPMNTALRCDGTPSQDVPTTSICDLYLYYYLA